MPKYIFTFFISFIVSIAFAQEKAVKVIPSQEKDAFNVKKVVLNKPSQNQLINTDYDYGGNNTIPNMLEMYDLDGNGQLDVVAVAMQRSGGSVTSRHIRMIVGNPTDGFIDFPVSAINRGAGWGTLQIPGQGPLADSAVVMFHQNSGSWIVKVDLNSLGAGVPDSVLDGNFPSFVYQSDSSIIATNFLGEVFNSSDQGNTFNSLDVFLDPDDPLIDPDLGYNSEYILKKSPNGQYIFNVLTWGRFGIGQFDDPPFSQDSSDMIGINYSTDGGATWQQEIIGYSGYTPVANRTDLYPIFANFGQVNGVVDNNGVIHITANGYAIIVIDEEGFLAFPAVYWNSRDRQWLAITDSVVDSDPNYNQDYRPGNGMGNAYPVPLITPDGQNIVVLWQGPEYAGTPGESEINIFEPTVQDPDSVYYSDLYYAQSTDGGATWSNSSLVPGASQQMVQESYPSPYNWLVTDDGTTAAAHFLYMIDDIPGTAIFQEPQNRLSDNTTWNYHSFDVSIVTGVEDNDFIANKFELGQNYPNPFNPSTLIKYTLGEKSLVILKVFDVLGREVETLVNSVKDPGLHEIVFDASGLASGLYIYRLETGSMTLSKKMMLLK